MGVRRPVVVEIDELVLDGLPPGQADQVARAVERELERLLAQQELPAAVLHDRAAELLVAEAGRLDDAATPQAVGVQVARAVDGALR